MTFNSEIIGRIIRGIIGIAMIAAGILYQNWVGFLGAYLLLGAFGLGCGASSSGCAIKPSGRETDKAAE